jgi:beta-1,4-N-acetylglucosaminyltransferase
MIFVTIGMSNYGFDRLLREVDKITPLLDEEVIIQIGHSKYKPINCSFFTFVSSEQMKKYYENSKIIISHGGIGSILNALYNQKILIVVPRLQKFGEIIDDNQLEISNYLERKNKIIAVYDIKNLYATIKKINYYKIDHINKKNDLSLNLQHYLRYIEKQD